jgi:glycosyltransferase involved in cell wall biosynthesis
MKVLLLTDGIFPFSMGGMQKHSTYLATYLTKNNVEVELVHCVDASQKIPTNAEVAIQLGISENNITVIHFPKSITFPGHYIFNSWKYSLLIYETFKNRLNEFDAIYSQGFTAWALLKFTKNNKRPKIIVNLHGVEMFQEGFSFKEKIQKGLLKIAANYVLKQADIVQSLGGKLTPILRQITRKNNVIECGIGIDEKWLIKQEVLNQKSPSRPIRFIFIGRYEKRKGIEVLNSVLLDLKNQKVNFEIHFIGPIQEPLQIKDSRFVYHGQINNENDIINILRDSDVLLLPSLSEGMPTVILEAMANGLAIIASNVGAVEEMLNKENGWLIEPGDVNQLKNAIIEAISCSQEKIKSMQLASFQKVQPFLWHNKIKDYLKLINC